MNVYTAYLNTVKERAIGSVGSPQLVLSPETGVSVTFDETAGVFTMTLTGAAITGLSAGSKLLISGASLAANNGVRTVDTVDTPGQVITTVEAFVDEADVETVSVTVLPA